MFKHYSFHFKMGCFMRKHAFCICKDKGADQLHGNFCLRNIVTIPLVSGSGVSSL